MSHVNNVIFLKVNLPNCLLEAKQAVNERMQHSH